MKGWMYILECVDGSYHVGSTTDLDKTIIEHQQGKGCDYTKNRLPVKLTYFEEFPHAEQAVYREKIIQGWCHSRKEALVDKAKDEIKFQSGFRNKIRRRSLRNLMTKG